MTAADFSGYATRHNVECSDGRTILADAFKDNDGMVVPLVWQHGHDDIENVLGHAKLENRPEGVHMEAFFNQTAKGQSAKEAVRHGDIKFLSIFANQLVERAKQVIKGNIREVSLVLAGANPGAYVQHVNIVHGDGDFTLIEDEAVITTGLELELAHAAGTATITTDSTTDTADDADVPVEKKTLQEILDTLDTEQETAVNYLLAQALTVGASAQHSDTDGDETAGETEVEDQAASETADESNDEASAESGDESNDEAASEGSESEEGEGDDDSNDEASAESDEASTSESDEGEGNDESNDESASDADSDTNEAGDAVQHDTINQEDNSMTHNVFDQAGRAGGSDTMTHQQTKLSKEEVKALMRQVVDGNSTLSSVLKHYATENGVTVGGELKHGIENIDYLFPDFQTLSNSPAFLARRMDWVDAVLSSVRKAPFARIKSVSADITPDEARARGYITGNMKNEEFFALSKRETTPQTVYKKQKLDRDDVIDIADFDVIAWLKAEMQVMLDEEIASAILFGDGRSSGDEDKIRETNIRPIASDAELYVTTAYVNLDDASSSAEEIVDSAITNREFYKGSGEPTFYTTQAIISKFKMAKDGNGQRYYKTTADIAAMLDVAAVVPVETMGRVPDLVGIMVNLADYTLGTDRGGQATMFDDFDLDYNKLRYLLEARLSGALTTPKAAVVFRKVVGTAVLVAPNTPAFNSDTGVLTVPTQTGVVYKNDSGTTLTTGSPVTVPAGESYHVTASPSGAGYYFADNAHDEWTFTTDAA